MSKGLTQLLVRLYQVALGDDETGRPLQLRMDQQEFLAYLTLFKEYLKTGKPIHDLSLFIVEDLSNGNQELRQRLDRLIQNDQVWKELHAELSLRFSDEAIDLSYLEWEKIIDDNSKTTWSLNIEYADRFPESFQKAPNPTPIELQPALAELDIAI